MILYRALGLQELRSLYQAQLRAFPRRLLGQPALSLLGSEEAARRTAHSWASPGGALAAFVTRCAVADRYGMTFATSTETSGPVDLEVPIEKLIEFNGQLEGPIAVIAAYHGGRFRGFPVEERSLDGASSEEQFVNLAALVRERPVQAVREMATHPLAVFVNFYFWEHHDFSGRGFDDASRDAALARIRQAWLDTEHGRMPLGITRC